MTPKLATRLSKLIPRLASEFDGEVVATARSIIATLAAAGKDLHDLASALECSSLVFDLEQVIRDWDTCKTPQPKQPDPSPKEAARPPVKEKKSRKPRRPPNLWDTLSREEIEALVVLILAEADLNANERATFEKMLVGVKAHHLFIYPAENTLFENHVAAHRARKGMRP